MKSIKVAEKVTFGNDLPFCVISGPCQMESEGHSMMMAESLINIAEKVGVPFVFKTSYDKANRTSVNSMRGIGLKSAIPIFQKIKETFKVPILTDVHTVEQCDEIAPYVDIIQIPAFLCRQTDLVVAAAQTGKIVNIKKGQFLSPEDIGNIVSKVEHCDSKKILLTDRGTSFGYNNLVVDMRSFPIMSKSGYPVIIDATHATQMPGGMGTVSGGNREYAPVLAKAAIATGIAGVFAEVHQDPDNAPSDGPVMLRLETFETFLKQLKAIDDVVKRF
ncbi:MAG: 2-dehydro-3-deoxyphosphooctonate aldolase (KDO 8-P synthase) [Candidatus Deianiraeaceae bacterium]|jgi:2-dehydro-3-deoxyphosphooctonate aldolase (KDO 8-P synthase)